MSILKTDFSTPEGSPGFLLWQMSNKWQAAQRQALTPFDLTHVQFVLLASLVWFYPAGSLTQKELALRAGVDVMMTSQVLRTLEKKGFVRRIKRVSDGRANDILATPSGIETVNEAIKIVEKVDEDFFAVLGGDRKQFTQLMKHLAV